MTVVRRRRASTFERRARAAASAPRPPRGGRRGGRGRSVRRRLGALPGHRPAGRRTAGLRRGVSGAGLGAGLRHRRGHLSRRLPRRLFRCVFRRLFRRLLRSGLRLRLPLGPRFVPYVPSVTHVSCIPCGVDVGPCLATRRRHGEGPDVHRVGDAVRVGVVLPLFGGARPQVLGVPALHSRPAGQKPDGGAEAFRRTGLIQLVLPTEPHRHQVGGPGPDNDCVDEAAAAHASHGRGVCVRPSAN